MKTNINRTFLLIAFSVVFVFCSIAMANDNSDTRTVTGCLAKADSANTFVLTASDGSTWDVESSVVPLGDHVGHTVAATGEVSHAAMHHMKEGAKDAAADAGMKKDNHEHGNLKVTSVKMVSDSCK